MPLRRRRSAITALTQCHYAVIQIKTYFFLQIPSFAVTLHDKKLCMERTEELIINQLRQGEERAYKYLYVHHYPVMCHVAAQLVKDDFLAETIAGDVIFHLWETRQNINIHTSIRSYLISAVHNRCLNFLSSQTQQREQTMSKVGLKDFSVVRYIQSDDYPLGRLLSKEIEDVIESAINNLPEDCRRVFKLSRFEGMHNDEIASQLGISINTVRYHIKHALSILRSQLGKYLMTLFIIFMQN